MAISSLLQDQAIITEAESEAQAIDLIRNNFFDLALIDMEIDEAKNKASTTLKINQDSDQKN